MLVVAALRFADERAEVDPLTGEVRTDRRSSGASEADRCALEHALRLAESFGGRCLAVTAAPPDADGMLRDALAAGAHEVLRVEPPQDDLVDAGTSTARALLDALPQRPDLVLCGDYSPDRGTGATPAYLAAWLGAAQALGLLELAADGDGLRAVRRLDGGRREVLSVPLPAVCSVEPTTVRLRRASLPATLAARNASIPTATPRDNGDRRLRVEHSGAYRPRPRELPPPTGDAASRVLALTGALQERTPPRVVTPTDAAEAADELLDFLRQNGYR